MTIGADIYDLCTELFAINRSLSGDGVRETLSILKRELPELNVFEIPTGKKCFDWEIPKEWNCKEAYIIDPDGNKICDFSQNNLHLVGYSTPIDKIISLEELNEHLYSLPDLPNAIPYITSYYKERWGFCITDRQRRKHKNGEYKVYIDSSLKDGHLTCGELLIKGESEEEVFFSTYVCHPSMANNELSGPTVVTHLAKYIQSLKNRRYSYRIIYIPETIGSIMYLSENIVAGFNVSCVGDDNIYSYLPSRNGDTLSDKIALHVLKHKAQGFKIHSFLDRGSDERQYCSPNVDLPICCISRSKYGDYKEYHTSLDNLDFISPEGLNGAYEVYAKAIDILEYNYTYKSTIFCEPQLGKRGLYPTLSTTDKKENTVKWMMDFLAYCDGKFDLVDIAEIINAPAWELSNIAEKFLANKLITRVQR